MAATMRFVKYFFGWLGILVDIGCLLIVAGVLWVFYSPGGGDALLLLLILAPFLLGIMLVATVISVVCFKSLGRAARKL
jgi:hypothetical protein